MSITFNTYLDVSAAVKCLVGSSSLLKYFIESSLLQYRGPNTTAVSFQQLVFVDQHHMALADFYEGTRTDKSLNQILKTPPGVELPAALSYVLFLSRILRLFVQPSCSHSNYKYKNDRYYLRVFNCKISKTRHFIIHLQIVFPITNNHNCQ